MAGERIGGTNQLAPLSVKERGSSAISSNLFIAVHQNVATKGFSFGEIRDKVMGGCWRALRLLEGSVLEFRVVQHRSVYLQMVRRRKN